MLWIEGPEGGTHYVIIELEKNVLIQEEVRSPSKQEH